MSDPVVPTSLKMPKALKARITRLAKKANESPHAFTLKALEDKVEDLEWHEQLIADAMEADKEMQRTGLGYPAGAVHEFMTAKAAGRTPAPMKPVKWRK